MTTWSRSAFNRALAALRAFTDTEPELSAKARADFPGSWNSERYPWMDMSLAAWLLHGREDDEGRTAAERRLLKEGHKLPRAERAILTALAASWCSVFEVEEVRLGAGLRLRDLLLDEVLEVREQSLTTQVARHDLTVLWVIPAEDHLELAGVAVLVPRDLREHVVVAARRELAARPAAGDATGRHRQARRLAPFLFRRVLELFTARRPLLNSEGEALRSCTARFRVRHRAEVEQRLRRHDGFVQEGKGHFSWLGPPGELANSPVVWGSLELEGDTLILTTHSEERLARARALLEEVLGDEAVHLEDTVGPVQTAPGALAPIPPGDLPPPLRAQLLHHLLERVREDVRRGIPAWGGRSARELVRSAEGRARVLEWLKDQESQLARLSEEYAGALDGVYRELGLSRGERIPLEQVYTAKEPPPLEPVRMELTAPELPAPGSPLPPPRRRAFEDAAGRRPRRKAGAREALEPGSAYVFKLGPIDMGLDGRASLYVAVDADGMLLAPQVGRRDAEGLQAMARELEGRTRYCESRLARAGAALGYVSRPMPAEVAALRAVLAVQVHWGPENLAGLPPEVVEVLLDASAELIRAAPWELWTNEEVFPVHLEGCVTGTRELSVLGNGGQEFGLALFDRAGSAERLALSGPPGEGLEVLVPDSLGLTLDDEPGWAVKAVQQVTGLPFVPSVMRVLRNTPRLSSAEEVLAAAAVARALASARPEEREAKVDVQAGDLHVRVRLEIPLPLLSGEYVGRALLAAPLLQRPHATGRPRRKVPTRKVSETLLEFARPLLEDMEYWDDPQEELFVVLALAMSAWNAVVQDTWEPEKGWVERARATLRRMPAGEREQMTRDFELLVERKRRHFADDPRLFDMLEVQGRGPGDLNVRLLGAVTPGAWAEFLGG